MSADGSWQEVIEGVRPFCREMSWSSQGEIAYNAIGGALEAVNLVTGQVRTIVPAGLIQRSSGDIMNIQWSPDGSRLVFWTRMANDANDERGWEIWVVNADGSGLRNLREPESNYGQIDVHWTPDSSQLVYTRFEMIGDNERGEYELWVMDADGGNRHQLTGSIFISTGIYYPAAIICHAAYGVCDEYSWDRD